MEIIITALTTTGAALTALGAVSYKLYRMIKRDSAGDGLHQESLEMIDVYKLAWVEERETKERLQNRLEAVEQERNLLSTEVGEMRANVEHLTNKISDLTNTCEALKSENTHLQETIDSYKEVLQAVLSNQNTLLEKINELTDRGSGYGFI